MVTSQTLPAKALRLSPPPPPVPVCPVCKKPLR